MHTTSRILTGILCAACCTVAGFTQPPPERFTIVNVFNEVGVEETRVMSESEIAALQKEIMEETRFHMLAVVRAQQTWTREGHKKAYPKALLKPRRFVRTTTHASAMEASDRIKRAEESLERYESNRSARKTPKTAPFTTPADNDATQKRQERLKNKEASKSEREKEADEVLGYYKNALQELQQEALAKAEEKTKMDKGAQ